MRNFGHRYILDYDFIKKISNNLKFSKIDLVQNYFKFDTELSKYLISKKPKVWDLETDTYLLIK